MAESHPKPLPNDGSDSPNKRKKTTTAGDSPPSKHSDESYATSDEEIENAATSKNPKNDPIEMDIDNIELMEAIVAYQKREGVSLRNSPGACGMFCYSYIKRGIGSGVKWLYKMYEMEIKFNNESAPTEDVEKKEFELWKKIWGNQQNDDDDPGVGSSN